MEFKLFLQLIQYFLQTQMTSSQESPSNLRDRDNKTYACFCQKIFTTYPGLYLHLKSKHTNVFPKYKKLKITKLFRKIKDGNGSELFQLDNLLEKDNNFRQKKNKQKKRMTESQDEKPAQKQEVQVKNPNKNILNQIKIPPTQYQNPQPNFGFKFQHQNPKDLLSRMGNPPFHFPFSNPYFGFPYGHPPPPFFPPPFSHFAPPVPNMKTEPSIKKFLQRFLLEAQGVQNKIQLKEILHELMIYIDRNSHSIQDPKTKQKLFLSYCDQFQPKLIGPLLNDFINHKQLSVDFYSQQKEKKLRQIGYIVKFRNWLKEIGVISITLQKDTHQTEPSPVQKEPLSESQNIKRISGVEGDVEEDDEEE